MFIVLFSDVLSLGKITLKITLSSLKVHNRFHCSCFEPITRAIGTSTVGHLNLHNRRAFLLIVANTCSNPYSGV
ncbi:unnamed protein product [Citrullus colocynthis]|uniref:Uncharacterized protein n=1 Tax=Citrullus colocynthis TaxID=252529 RepID=A0ABP0Z6F7_9ROSI